MTTIERLNAVRIPLRAGVALAGEGVERGVAGSSAAARPQAASRHDPCLAELRLFALY